MDIVLLAYVKAVNILNHAIVNVEAKSARKDVGEALQNLACKCLKNTKGTPLLSRPGIVRGSLSQLLL